MNEQRFEKAWLTYAQLNAIHPHSIERDVFEAGFDAANDGNDERQRIGYKAVWDSGLLTPDVYTNARIWRAVETAIKAALPSDEEAP